jgi:hypothetical protein
MRERGRRQSRVREGETDLRVETLSYAAPGVDVW